MKKYSCKGSFLPLIRKEVRRHEKKTNTGAWGMPSLSWEENQRCTVIFQETINASPFWIRRMTARTARSWASPEQTGAGYEMPPMVLWSGDPAPGDRPRLICRRTEPPSVDAWSTVPRLALAAARGSRETSLNYRISLDPLSPFSRSPHPAARPSLLPSTFRLSTGECWDGACSSSQQGTGKRFSYQRFSKLWAFSWRL